MDIVHIALLTASAALLAATHAGATQLRRRGPDMPLIGYIIGTALLIGNAACLLPSAPGWYRISIVAASVAGLLWFATSVVSARPQARPTDAEVVARDIYAGRMPHPSLIPAQPVRPARPARPALRVVPDPAPEHEIVEATIVEDEPVRVATQHTFTTAGPVGGHTTTGQTYVAAGIDTYVDARRTRRGHGTHVARTHTTMDPTERFLRLAEAYSIDRGPRSLGRSSMA